MRTSILSCAFLCAIASNPAPLWAQSIPGSRQASILTRALAYSRTLKERAGKSLVVGVLYRAEHTGSESMSNEMYLGFRTLESFAVRGLPFSVIRVAYEDAARLSELIRSEGIDALYVCSGLDDEIGAIVSVTRASEVLSFAGLEDYVARGVSLGVFAVDNKPTIYLNKVASQLEGADFGVDFVQLTTLVDGR